MKLINKTLKTFLIVISIFSMPVTFAGSAGQGLLRQMHFMSNGVVIAYTTGARTGVPACAVSQPTRFAIDGASVSGKTQLSGLLAAYASGKQVVIVGADNCLVYSGTETISYFYTAD